MFGLGVWELVIIAVVVVLLFGTKRLPELGSGLGEAIGNFRSSLKGTEATDQDGSETIDVSDDTSK